MSEEDFGFAPPPFKTDAAWVQIGRALRDLGLAERGPAFELRGKGVVELQRDGGHIAVRLARRPALTPDWDRMAIRTATEQRKFIDEVRKRLARWERED
ncbi:MAG: hypothetical protein KGL18_01685 [Burkholderiales bacterium]|nr:hypothetical protein [Burkholderiales bacterium]MDE2501677.1 hypothetical protein [Burkholderiales bacterium]